MTERSPGFRVSLTTSLIVSVVAAAASSGATYGKFMGRLDTIEARQAAAEKRQQEQDAVIAQLVTNSAVVAQQYVEINRRLSSIETAVGAPPGDRRR